MARGSEDAKSAAQTGNQFARNYGGNAENTFSFLSPMLMNEAAHPAGMSPTDLAATDTATRQAAGGTQSAAVGQGLLKSARTRNAGGADAAIASAARTSGDQATNAALQTRLKNASLKIQQQQEAERGLEGLYGTSVGGSNAALDSVAKNVNANTEAEDASWNWAKYILDPALAAAGQGAGLAAKGCWIAEAIYGVDDWRTRMVRAWLNGPFRTTTAGSIVMKLYLRFGKRIASITRRSSLLRRLLKPLFDKALSVALTDECGWLNL